MPRYHRFLQNLADGKLHALSATGRYMRCDAFWPVSEKYRHRLPIGSEEAARWPKDGLCLECYSAATWDHMQSSLASGQPSMAHQWAA